MKKKYKVTYNNNGHPITFSFSRIKRMTVRYGDIILLTHEEYKCYSGFLSPAADNAVVKEAVKEEPKKNEKIEIVVRPGRDDEEMNEVVVEVVEETIEEVVEEVVEENKVDLESMTKKELLKEFSKTCKIDRYMKKSTIIEVINNT